MRILATADLHLGKIYNNFSFLQEQQQFLDQIAILLSDEDIDVLVIAGDIYDRAIPNKDAISMFDEFISNVINKLEKKVILISGNHDSYERLSFARRILGKNNYFIGEKFNGKVDVISLNDGENDINFYLLPYMHYQELYKYSQDINSYDNAYKYMIDTINTNDDINIGITHAFIIGNSQEEEIKSDSVKTLNVGGTDYVHNDKFDKFDFTIVGHLHRAHNVGNDKIHYPGSPLKYSFSEHNHKKTFTLIDIKAKDDISLSLIDVKYNKDMIVVKGYFNEILNSNEKYPNTKSYVKVVLEDKSELLDVNVKLKDKYPNLVEIVRQEFEILDGSDDFLDSKLVARFKTSDKLSVMMEMFEGFAYKTKGITLDDEMKEMVKKTAIKSIKEHDNEDK